MPWASRAPPCCRSEAAARLRGRPLAGRVLRVTPELAIANNHALYFSVSRAHGLVSRLEEHYWSTDAVPPPYYSHLVTRTRGAVAREAQVRRLSELVARAGSRGVGCNDSFDELPGDALETLGLRPLFRAWWYGWAADGVATAPETRLEARRVDSPEALSSWETYWRRSSPASEARVFPETVLADADLELFAMALKGRWAGGFALSRSDGAVGLSNVFHLESSKVDAGAFVRDCAREARRLHGGHAMVGYGPEDELGELMRLGFVALGPLRVSVAR